MRNLRESGTRLGGLAQIIPSREEAYQARARRKCPSSLAEVSHSGTCGSDLSRKASALGIIRAGRRKKHLHGPGLVKMPP